MSKLKFPVILTSCFSCFSSAALSLLIALCVPLNSRFCSFIISGKKILIAGQSFSIFHKHLPSTLQTCSMFDTSSCSEWSVSISDIENISRIQFGVHNIVVSAVLKKQLFYLGCYCGTIGRALTPSKTSVHTFLQVLHKLSNITFTAIPLLFPQPGLTATGRAAEGTLIYEISEQVRSSQPHRTVKIIPCARPGSCFSLSLFCSGGASSPPHLCSPSSSQFIKQQCLNFFN